MLCEPIFCQFLQTFFLIQSNTVYTDIEGAIEQIESVRIKWVNFRENLHVMASFPQEQRKLSVVKRCPY